MTVNSSVRIATAVFKADEGHYFDQLEGMCGQLYSDSNYEEWADWVYRDVAETEYVSNLDKTMDTEFPEGTRWRAHMNIFYRVIDSGWYNVAVKVCDDSGAVEKVLLDGKIAFKNPYGFLMGEMWGQIPFQFARSLLFGIFGCLFLWLFLVFRESVMKLHFLVLGVFALATLESATWTIAYMVLNEDGVPYCCPFSKEVKICTHAHTHLITHLYETT